MNELSAKNKRLLRSIASREHGRYADEFSQSEADRVQQLLALGLVEKTYGSWSGALIYKASPQVAQK